MLDKALALNTIGRAPGKRIWESPSLRRIERLDELRRRGIDKIVSAPLAEFPANGIRIFHLDASRAL